MLIHPYIMTAVGSAPSDGLLSVSGVHWLTSVGGADYFAQVPPPAAPNISNASGSVAENVSIGTLVGTMTNTGGLADAVSITAGNTGTAFAATLIDSGATVEIRTAAELDYETLASYSLTVQVSNLSGTQTDSATFSVTVTDVAEAHFSTESGENIVLGVSAWASTTALGSSVTVGSITGWFRTNAGKLYYAATGGTTGSTAPTHTSGTASDGSITWEYCCTVDRTSLSDWETNIPSTLVADVVGIVWADAEYTSSATNMLIINSRTVGSYTVTLKAKEELGWYSHASPVGRYDASKGVAFRNTDPDYGRGIRIECDRVRIKGLQIKCASTTQDRAAITEEFGSPGYASIYDRLILASGGQVAFVRGLLRNSYVIKDSADTANVAVNLYNGGIAANCVIARPSNNTAGGVAVQGHYDGGGVLVNCGVFGFTSAPIGTVVATYTASDNATSIPSGTGNITVSFNTTHVVQPSAASALDLRIPSGSSLKNAGTTDTTHIPDSKDAFGATRSGTWDIGPHEVG